MSGYQVLARKWRPQRFEQVVGQEAVVRTLVNALQQGRIAHAYCFSGIRGVGKTTVARLLAKGLNCHAAEGPTAEPCCACPSCLEIEESRSLDVVELDAASRTRVEEMRQLLEISRYAPSRDRYRVFIIDEAHMLSASSFNAMLKTLEEPPPNVVFVLATTEPNKLLPTVLSRCQHYSFARIAQGRIAEHLGQIAEAEGVRISADALALVAAAADGSLRDAQSLLDKLIAFAGTEIEERQVLDLLGLVDRVLLFRAVDRIAEGDVAGVLALVEEMVEGGVDLHQFAVDLLGHLRNLLVVHSVRDPGPVLHLPEEEVERLRAQAERFTVEDLDRAFQLVAASEYRIKTAEQPRYHLEVLLARLARMPSLVPLEEIVAALRGENDPGPSAPTGEDESSSRTNPAGGTRSAPRGRGSVSAPPRSRSAGVGGGAVHSPSQRAHAAETGDPRGRGASVAVPVTAAVADAPTRGTPRPDLGERSRPGAARPARRVAAAGPSDLLQRLQERLEQSSPLIGNVLARASSVSLKDGILRIRFPATAGIFAERVRDPRLLPQVTAAAAAVLGRDVRVRVELEAAVEAPGAPASGAAAPPPADSSSRSAVAGAPVPARAPAGEAPEQTSADPLWQRAENDPRVQGFLTALRGSITGVEEMHEDADEP